MEKNSSNPSQAELGQSSFVIEEQVRLLFMQAPISNCVIIIIALLYYFLLRSSIDSSLLLAWTVMLVLSAVFRLSIWYRRKRAPASRSAKSWLYFYTFGCALVGITWSLIYLFVYGALNDPLVMAALLMLAFGVMSSAVPILSVYMPSFVLYTYPQATLLAFSFIRFDDTAYTWLALAIATYMVMLTLFTRNANHSILQSIRLQEQNLNLIDNLNQEINQREELIAQRTLELEKTNSELLTEIKDRERTKDRLVQANANLDATLKAIPDLMFELDKSGRYIDVWAHDPELLATQKDTTIGRTVAEVLPADAASIVMQAIELAANNGTSHGQIIKLPYNQGDRWFELSTSRKQYNDNTTHFLMLSRDITDKQQSEAEKQRMQRELQQSRKMESLGHLTGGIAHDFNNLLQAISGFAGLALDISNSKRDSEQTQYLNHLMNASDRAANLVSQMLSFSRQDRVESLPMELSRVLKEEVDLLRATLPSTIEIEAEIEEKLPQVMMNPTQLQQMIMNLCVNARDAMGGQGKLTIRLGWVMGLDAESTVSHKPIKGDWIEISIKDSGSGIEPEIIDDIFTPFYTTKGIGEGTGMGLSVVYGIMENLGGEILLNTELAKGSSFHLLFPPITKSASKQNLSGSKAHALSMGGGENILLVDDEKNITLLLDKVLTQASYRVTAVNDSLEALSLFEAEPYKFNVLITDQTMPKLSGVELVSRLRDIRANLPVILFTGFSDKINEDEALELNIHFFRKPLKTDVLIQKLADIFSQSLQANA